jgi:hypothetical protein
MDTARMAAQSDPDMNPHFRRRWADLPPQKRKRPALAGTSNRADFIKVSESTYSTTETAAQLDRAADLLLSVGRRLHAEYLANRAATMRTGAVR